MIGARIGLSVLIALWLHSGNAGVALAQTYPQKPIKLVVPFPAGGATDTAARVVAQGLSSKLGHAVIIENQGGAGGTIGARQVASAVPDGYTLLMAGPSITLGIAPLIYKLDYDPREAFAPVASVAFDRVAMVVTPSLSINTVQELVQYAKANPGRLNYGSAIGIVPHFIAEVFKRRTGTDIVHVPYRGGAPVIADLLGGQIQMTVNNKSVLLPHIRAGKLKALAVTGAERWRDLPDVPTLVEVGYMDGPFDALFGVVAPAGTPASTIDTLNGAFNEALRSSEVRESFAKLGMEPMIGTPQEFATAMAYETPRWAEIVKTSGIKVE
jgi:tripartite-type tricarboxylate transporter receptor subunit TctC